MADNKRDSVWEQNFLELFPTVKINLLKETPQSGPDNFPYLLIETSEKAAEPAKDVLAWLSDKGIGLVLNPQKEFPDYIWSYGMIWNYAQTGKFITETSEMDESASDQFFVGTPSESYLPRTVRTLIKQFCSDQGIMKPKITMLSKDQRNFDLCFSIESFGSPSEKEHDGILRALAWFLPNHYSLAMVSESDFSQFIDL